MQNQKKYIFEHGVDHTIYRLFENGYEVIPISGKACYLANWTKIDITQDLITEWLVDGYPVKQKDGSTRQAHMTGTGIRCGKVAGVDLDITDADVCTMMQTWLDDHWDKAPIRIGRAPKALAVYYQPEPQRKMRMCFVDQDGNDQAIEILGVGQQFVADGRHPKTGKPYQWVRDSLVDTSVVELPEAGDYDALLAEFTRIALERGWKLKGKPMRGGAAGSPEDMLLNMSSPVGMTLYEIEQLLRKIEPADDYDSWYPVAMMIHTETDGSEEGYALLDWWSGSGSGYDPENNRKLWEGLKPRSLNGRGLYKLAGLEFGSLAEVDEVWEEIVGDDQGDQGDQGGDTDEDLEVLDVDNKEPIVMTEVDDFLADLEKCDTDEAVMALIGESTFAVDDIWKIEKPVQTRMKLVTGGSMPGINVVRGWLKERVSQDGGTGGQVSWARGWVFLTHQGMFYHYRTGKLISMKAFNTMMKRYLEDGEPSEFLARVGALPVFWNIIYAPGQPAKVNFNGVECINSYRGFPDHGDGGSDGGSSYWDTVLAHAKKLYPNKWHILIDFFAALVQQPGRKIKWMPVLQGVQGDGKSYWGRLMEQVLGLGNVTQVSAAEIQSEFSDWAEGRLLSVIEELRISGANKKAAADRLKPYITNELVRINPKGIKGFQVVSCTSYIAFTNHKDAIPIDDTDRRYLPFFSTIQRPEQRPPRAYYDVLYDTMDAAEVFHRLKDWKISKDFSWNFCPEIEGDKDKREMLELSKSDIQSAVEDYLSDPERLVNVNKISDFVTDPMGDHKLPQISGKMIRQILSSLGYVSDGKKRVGEKTLRVWQNVSAERM